MRALEPLTGRVSLIPVPLGARRLADAGLQPERADRARRWADARPRRCGPTCSGAARETPTQTALTPEARQANVAGAFAAARRARARACVLVDDVFTTGATLAAAAAALAGGGAARVEAVTFARAPSRSRESLT